MYKKWIENKKVVCFDLDGTIADTVAPAVIAFSKILQLANPDINVKHVYGKVGESLYEKWARIADQKLIKNNMSVKDLTENTNIEYLKLISEIPLEPKPGFWDLIYKLKEEKNLPIALATNSNKNITTQVLNKLDINGVFDFIIYGDDVKRPKPHPEIYQKVAKNFNVRPQEMLVFEDSLLGVKSAASAGASVVVVWDGQTSKNIFPEAVLAFVQSFEGIADTIDTTVDEELAKFRTTQPTPKTQN